ncbi:MAG: WW domain-containing protein [Acidobacteria bacterium]|jgi:hypothetical protein|nr:WW domain-containing protein [Acidobacteriota bacterium]
MLKKNLFVFTTITLAVAFCFMVCMPLLAYQAGWTASVDPDGTTYYYNEAGILKIKVWMDADNKVHIDHYSIIQKQVPNPFGEIQVNDSTLGIFTNVDAENLAIYDMSNGNLVWENGGPVHVNDEFVIPITDFSNNLHMIATLDGGFITNTVIFSKGNDCTGPIIGQ